MANMPIDIKKCILNHHPHCAHIATEDTLPSTLSLALVQLPADHPLTLALSQDHHDTFSGAVLPADSKMSTSDSQ